MTDVSDTINQIATPIPIIITAAQGTSQSQGVAPIATPAPLITPQTAGTIAKPIIRDANGHFVKGNTESVGNPGKPCSFCMNKEKYLTPSRAYIARCKDKAKPFIPYFEEYALEMGVHRETVLNWINNENHASEHSEIIDAYKTIHEYQRLRLQQRTMGRYNPTGAIFLLKTNHKFIETEKQIHAGDANEPMKLDIQITEARKPDSDDNEA